MARSLVSFSYSSHIPEVTDGASELHVTPGTACIWPTHSFPFSVAFLRCVGVRAADRVAVDVVTCSVEKGRVFACGSVCVYVSDESIRIGWGGGGGSASSFSHYCPFIQ